MFKIEKAFILSIVLIATISLIGWGFDLLIITRISNAFIPMAPLSSILFIFCGVAYWFSLKETKKPIHQITGKTLIFIALFILSLELLGGISNFDLEKIFVSNPSFFINVPIARISPFTVVFFYIVCFSYLLLSKIHVEIYRKTYAILTLILLLFSSIFLIGYVENLPLAYNSEIIPMALLTSLSFWILSLLQLKLLKFRIWPFYYFLGNSIISRLLRFTIPTFLVFIFLLEFIESHNILQSDDALSSALLLLISIPFFLFVIIKIAQSIGKDLQQTNQKLIESKELYRNMIDSLLEGFYSVTLKGKLLNHNTKFAELLGLDTTQSHIGISLPDYWQDPQEREIFLEEISKNGFIKDYLVNVKKVNGVAIIVRVSSQLIKDPQGNPLRIDGVIQDITEQQRLRGNLNESEKRLKLSLEVNHASVFENNFKTGEVINTPELYLFLGYNIHEIPTTIEDTTKLIHPDDLPLVLEAVSKHFSGITSEYYAEFRMLSKSGDWRWVDGKGKVVKRNEKGEPEVLLGISRDINTRKQTEMKLFETEAIFNHFMEKSPIYVFFKDEKIRSIKLSKNYETMLGMPISDLLNKNMYDLFPSELAKSMIDDDIKILNEGKVISVEEEFNGHIYSTIKFPIHIEGKPRYLAGYTIDITEQKHDKNELIKAKDKAEESDRLKSAFLANMSHEIRTPMNGILGFSELLKNPDLSGDKKQKYIHIIEKSGIRMLNIINDIIDISKIEAGLMKLNIKESNVNEQLQYIYSFFKPEANAKGIVFILKNPLPKTESIIFTDREKTYGILTNLVKNAIKYTENGTIEFGCFKKGDFLEFFVKDSGIGISEDRQEAIFERFIQADIINKMARQGVGLGLSISKAYVEIIGGKIWVESEKGIGSTFYFTLPYHASLEKVNVQEETIQKKLDNENASIVSGLKILIAEDDEISEMLLEIALRSVGKEILKARTGLEAVETCRNNPDIDLILMDIQMPELNGYEATQQIRLFNKKVVIIAQTAFSLSGDNEKAIAAGCSDYISKPVNSVELLALINKHFAE